MSGVSVASDGLSSLYSSMASSSPLDRRAAQPKRVVVVGAGTQGLTTAYWLGRAGHAVTVVDRAPAGEFGSAASYTGLMQTSSVFSPLLARPQLFKAYKVQWCPYTQYTHPNLRVGLFDSNETSNAVRSGMMAFCTRDQWLTTARRLHGLGLYNGFLMRSLLSEWNAGGVVAQTSRGWFGAKPAAGGVTTAATAVAVPIAEVRSSVTVAFEDQAWKDVRNDLDMQRFLHDPEAKSHNELSVPPPIATSDAAASRFQQLSDLQVVARMPSLKPKEFEISGGILFQDELAVDNIAFLNRLKRESTEKFGVQFQYDTEVTRFIAHDTTNAPDAVSGSAPAITAVETAKGPLAADAFVLCTGADSKRLVRASRLPTVTAPIPTFTTQTTHLSFPNPFHSAAVADSASLTTAAATNDAAATPVLPAASVVLPESHTVITPFPTQIRISCGDDINPLDHPTNDASPSASSPAQQQQLAVSPNRLLQMVTDLNGLFPFLTRDVISQNGATVPHVSLRTWTFDNKPLLGRYHPGVANLFVNTAHGNLGWTNALAAGKHVSDILSDNDTFIQPEPFEPKRFLK